MNLRVRDRVVFLGPQSDPRYPTIPFPRLRRGMVGTLVHVMDPKDPHPQKYVVFFATEFHPKAPQGIFLTARQIKFYDRPEPVGKKV